MNITVKLYAVLDRYLPTDSQDNTADLAMASGDTVTDTIRRLGLPTEHCHLVLVNGIFVPPGERDTCVLHQGDALAIWPPVAGG